MQMREKKEEITRRRTRRHEQDGSRQQRGVECSHRNGWEKFVDGIVFGRRDFFYFFPFSLNETQFIVAVAAIDGRQHKKCVHNFIINIYTAFCS